MVDLNVLNNKKSATQGVSPEEAMLGFFDSDDYTEVETALMQLNRICMLRKIKIDNSVEELVGTEGFVIKSIKTIYAATKKVAFSVNKFIKWMYESIKDKVVTESYIHNKFKKLDNVIKSITETRAYVEEVPTYEDLEKRLVSILQVVDYIKALSEKEKFDESVNSMIQKVVLKSGGLLKISKPDSDSPYSNIKWREAEYSEYDIKSSKWAKPQNTEKLKNLMLKAKYESVDQLTKAAKNVIKKCNAIENDESDYGYGGDAENPDYDKLADSYNVAYVVGKLIKQVYSQGIQKEVNMIAICYLYRLTQYEIK